MAVCTFNKKSSVNSSINSGDYFPLIIAWSGMWLNKSWKVGSRPGSPFGVEDKAPWTYWMFYFWRIYRLSTDKKLEVWTQYRLLLSFIGGYFSSLKKILRQRETYKNPEKSQDIYLSISRDVWYSHQHYTNVIYVFLRTPTLYLPFNKRQNDKWTNL